MKMLRVNDIDASYGIKKVLHQVGLVIHEGEIVTLFGHNGAGKSTLARVIAGMLRPDSGKVEWNGVSLIGKNPDWIVAQGIRLLPDGGRGIFPNLTVMENLTVSATSRDKAVNQQQLEFVLELFPDLKSRLNVFAGSLSGGQQQMVAIGGALMARPKLLILDEPFTGLAPILVDKINSTIIRLKEELKISVLLIEQNIKKALSVSQRSYVMRNGTISDAYDSKDLLQESDFWEYV